MAFYTEIKGTDKIKLMGTLKFVNLDQINKFRHLKTKYH